MALSAGLQLLALFFPPVRAVLGGAALPLVDVGIAAIGAVAPIVLIEIERLIRARMDGAAPTRRAAERSAWRQRHERATPVYVKLGAAWTP